MNSVEHNNFGTSRMARKRGLSNENEGKLGISMDELNEDVLESVLLQLPTSASFCVSSLCKRRKSVVASQSFKLACSLVPLRDPWFFMVDQRFDKCVVFDSSEKSWKKLNHLSFFQINSKCNYMPIAASGGLICFKYESGGNYFVVCNPVIGSYIQIPPLEQEKKPLCVIAMHTYGTSYKLILIFSEFSKLSFKTYNSSSDCWEQEIALNRIIDDSVAYNSNVDNNPVYFLSKTGNVVATNMERIPSKQFSVVTITKNDEDFVYFLNSSGTVVSCNLTRNCFVEYPRLLPAFH